MGMEQKIIFFKMVHFPQLIYRFNTIFVKIPADIFAEINKLFLKFMWKSN